MASKSDYTYVDLIENTYIENVNDQINKFPLYNSSGEHSKKSKRIINFD